MRLPDASLGVRDAAAGTSAAAAQEARTATLLLDVARFLSENHNVFAVADAVAEATRQLTGSQRSAVALVDPDTHEVTIAGKSGWPAELAAKFEHYATKPHESAELRQLLREQAPVLLNGRSSARVRELLAAFGVQAAVAVPVKYHGTFHGLLNRPGSVGGS